MMKKGSIFLLLSQFIISTVLLPFFAVSVSADSFSDSYYQLDYIQSSGSQWIDSGVSVSGGHSYEIKASVTAESLVRAIYGYQQSSYQDSLYLTASNTLRYEVRNKYVTFNYTSGSDFVFKGSSILNASYGELDGSQLEITGTNSNSFPNKNIYIFARNNNGSVANISTAKIYYFKIWDSSDTLVRSFIPAMRRSDSVVGLYDSVSGSFFTNSGSGSFTYGSIVLDTYTISTSVSPSGSGSVSGGGTYTDGSNVTLTATPASGYVFSEWSDGNTSNPRSITVSGDASYTAIFVVDSGSDPDPDPDPDPEPVTYFNISGVASPSSGGSVSGGGSYANGSTATLTASPNLGYTFSSWSDGVTDNPRTVSVVGDATYTALFSLDDSYSPDTIVGVNTGLIYGGLADSSYSFAYVTIPITFVLNDDYIGYIDYRCSFYVTGYGTHSILNRRLYFNGSSATDYVSVRCNYAVFDGVDITGYYSSLTVSSFSYTVSDHQFLKRATVENILSDGTEESQSSSSDLSNRNDQMSSDMNDLATIENGYNQNFNDQLQNIDFTNPLSVNSGILPAANFVISVFNGLILNNPFSTLIIIVCILLIGKKVIGK